MWDFIVVFGAWVFFLILMVLGAIELMGRPPE